MRTVLLISRFKDLLRNILAPLLPLIHYIRTFPACTKAKKAALPLRTGQGIAICYLTGQFPHRPALRTEFAHGGEVKMTFLAEVFPHSYPTANLLYTVSSVNNVAKTTIVRQAKENGLKIIINQNGVAYQAWHGKGWEETNRKMRDVYELADFIVYQSEFCLLGAEKFLGKAIVPSKIIYNPVDLDLYCPTPQTIKRKAPVLLLGGNQFAPYRLEVALQVLKILCQRFPDSRLIVTGKLWGKDQAISKQQANDMLTNLALVENVEFTGPYSQDHAAKIFQRSDILIHTQYNDASPTLIGESLACGVPVIYSASGGVPELVGPNAGIGIHVEQSWERISLPDPTMMAEAALKIWERQQYYRDAARQQAVEKLSLDRFIQLHKSLFAQVLA